MNSTTEGTTKQKKRTRPIFWVLLGFFLAVPALLVIVGLSMNHPTTASAEDEHWSSMPGQESGSMDKYYLAAQHEQGEREEQVLQSLRIAESIKASTLSEYTLTTIGSAFEAFFQEPKWELKTAANGARFVQFSGLLKNGVTPDAASTAMAEYGIDWTWQRGDEVKVKFAISADSSAFELWSMQMGNGMEIRRSDWERRKVLDLLLDAIYDIP